MIHQLYKCLFYTIKQIYICTYDQWQNENIFRIKLNDLA